MLSPCFGHYRGQAEPSVHADAIKAKIPGAIDPAARSCSQVDGRQLLQMCTDLALHVVMADNSSETGLYRVVQELSSGRLKVFQSLT